MKQTFQFPSEFRTDGDIYKLFNDNNLIVGRMISGSKSGYKEQYPDNLVIFNANIITKSRSKVWFGDIDVTFDFDNLKTVADKLGEDLYILYEMDARFGTENDLIEELINKAVIKIKSE